MNLIVENYKASVGASASSIRSAFLLNGVSCTAYFAFIYGSISASECWLFILLVPIFFVIGAGLAGASNHWAWKANVAHLTYSQCEKIVDEGRAQIASEFDEKEVEKVSKRININISKMNKMVAISYALCVAGLISAILSLACTHA